MRPLADRRRRAAGSISAPRRPPESIPGSSGISPGGRPARRRTARRRTARRPRVPGSGRTAPSHVPALPSGAGTARCSAQSVDGQEGGHHRHPRAARGVAQGGGVSVPWVATGGTQTDDQRVDVGPVRRRPHGGGQVSGRHTARRGPAAHRRPARRPASRQASIGQHAQRAGVADDPDPVARRHRLGGQQLGDVERRRQAVGADHPGLREQGRHRGLGQGSACRAAPTRAITRACRPDFTAITGFVRASTRASRANLRGLPNDSRYSSTTSVRSSPCQNCSRSLPDTSARLPAETKVDRPSAAVGGVGEDRDAQRAGLAEEADPAGRRHHRRQGGVHPHGGIGVHQAQAVRPEHPHPGAPATATMCRCALGARPAPASAKPAVITTRPCTPLTRQDSTTSATVAAGTVPPRGRPGRGCR